MIEFDMRYIFSLHPVYKYRDHDLFTIAKKNNDRITKPVKASAQTL